MFHLAHFVEPYLGETIKAEVTVYSGVCHNLEKVNERVYAGNTMNGETRCDYVEYNQPDDDLCYATSLGILTTTTGQQHDIKLKPTGYTDNVNGFAILKNTAQPFVTHAKL
ncbi:unnamed protein product [Absidia cylindrospora]